MRLQKLTLGSRKIAFTVSEKAWEQAFKDDAICALFGCAVIETLPTVTKVARLDFVRPQHSSFKQLILHSKNSVGLATLPIYYTVNKHFKNVSLINFGVTIATQ